jgi:hypothetical protein
MIDENLDAALREYSNREPRPGIERRVLSRVQAPPARRSWWFAGWVLAAAALLAAIALRHDQPKVQPVPRISRVAQSTPAPQIPVHSTIRHKVSEVKKFSAPEPLTAEERALLRFVQSQPEQAREVLSQTAQIEELAIEPLKIDKLQ